ncbi:MAG TPA: sugar ABC transporter ATP-binding protein [Acetobacteraceae bacterium]|jgi:ABC-type sugar transport system ATPase subunit|nr:sugar ABC transporter ATP-binding protein [Acetobacteraceae bacterium]
MTPDAIAAHGVGKRYGGVVALRAVSLALRAGEVMALLGANGAGKSTLIGVLSGAVAPDEGHVEVAGRVLPSGDVAAARRAGVSVVHQELMLFPDRSVVENVTATALPLRWTGLLDRRRQRAAAAATLARLGLHVPLDAPVVGLSLAQRQLVEIGRALFTGGRVLILDEPTSALSLRETEALLSIIRSLAAEGTAVLFVSHRLDEAASIADRITVLRDGQVAGTWQRGAIDVAGMARAMVGDVSVPVASGTRAPGQPVLEARELRGPGLGPISLSVRAGDIVGLVGLEGSGIDTLLRGLGGAAPLQGEITVNGRPVRLRHPADALRAGLVYMPPDRKLEGLWLDRSPVWNIATAPLRRCAAWRWPGAGQLGRLARERMAQVGVRLSGAHMPVRRLSGGNQQRVLFARSLEQKPAILLLSDPTRGVDVRAKSEIHRLIEALAADGIAVCLSCSGVDEVLALARRIVCMRAGRIVADGPREEFDEARALALVSSAVNRAEAPAAA